MGIPQRLQGCVRLTLCNARANEHVHGVLLALMVLGFSECRESLLSCLGRLLQSIFGQVLDGLDQPGHRSVYL